ncbi:hypothetical protein K6119_07535 [Paracrocinitomix mangrovi]|uniref:hypothetical protein n=1 Tax=Paracrocinitomix mangrovi TaxID=2862509 RepID=UPI001C8EC21D|nr:hypothetical protein [Paracrocinitomix mangrovi]UKN03366.1 hypothetical protein K6119_07535 [Paracrocinitomix mangrovi]
MKKLWILIGVIFVVLLALPPACVYDKCNNPSDKTKSTEDQTINDAEIESPILDDQHESIN